jgi:hypothetical protein
VVSCAADLVNTESLWSTKFSRDFPLPFPATSQYTPNPLRWSLQLGEGRIGYTARKRGAAEAVVVVKVEDFVKAMDAIVSRRLTGALNLFNPQLVPMRKLVETINTAAGRRPPTVSVQLRIALLLLAISEKLRLPLPFGADNVRSLKQSRAGVYQSDLETIVAEPCRFEPAVEAVVRAVTEGMAARRVQFHS